MILNLSTGFYVKYILCLIGIIIGIIIFWVLISFIIKVIKRNTIEKIENKIDDKNLINSNVIDYYRDIPCNGDLLYILYICDKDNLINKRVLKYGIMSAFILKWTLEKRIKIVKNDETDMIDFSFYTDTGNDAEDKLYQMLVGISGDNKLLEKNEFKKWSIKNSVIYDSWYNYAVNCGKIKSQEDGLVFVPISENVYENERYHERFREVKNQILGLKKYLLSFSIVKEKDKNDVHLLEYYFIIASLFGITDRLSEDFKHLFSETYVNFSDFGEMLEEAWKESWKGND